MGYRITLVVLLPFLFLNFESMQEITIDKDDIEITGNVVVKKGVYTVADKNNNGVLIVKADNVTIDFNGAVLQGTDDSGVTPNKYLGTGMVVEGRKGVVIKNAIIRHMLMGLHVFKSDSITIQNCDVSKNFAQRLRKSDDGPCTGDHWLTQGFDPDCWKTLGAGVLLRDSEKCLVSGCTGKFGQNGIMMIRAHECRIYDNDMSFNSGWGLRLYGACKNQITYNKFDYCARCHGNDISGDSASILVQRGSCENIFAYNSATHGGDGFFLGSATESLKDGSDNNLVMYNDFSYSPCNAIESTFSKGNKYIRNKCNYSGYGIWAGLSYENWYIENEIIGCGNDGIAIENGHDTVIEGNIIEHCGNGIRLWSNPHWVTKEKAKSARYHILRNDISFSKNVGVDLSDTPDTEIINNVFKGNCIGIKLAKSDGTTVNNNNFIMHGKVPESIAQNKKTTASTMKEKAQKAVDGSKDKKSDSAWGPVALKRGDWWQVDLGDVTEFNAIVIHCDNLTKFHIDASSKEDFAGEEKTLITEGKRVAKVQNNIDNYLYYEDTAETQWQRIKRPGYSVFTFPKIKSRYVRIVHDDSRKEEVSMHEFEVYNKPDLEKEYFSSELAIKNEGSIAVDASKNYWGTVDEKEISNLFSNPKHVDYKDPAKEHFKIGPIVNSAKLPLVKGTMDISLPKDIPKGVRYMKINQWWPVVPSVGHKKGEGLMLSQKQIYCVISKDDRDTVEIGRIKIDGAKGGFKLEDVPKELRIEKTAEILPTTLIVRLSSPENLPSISEKSFRVTFPDLKKTETVQILLVRLSYTAKLFKWDPGKVPIEDKKGWEKLFAGKSQWEGELEKINFRWGWDAPTFTKGLSQGNYAMQIATTIETSSDCEFYFRTYLNRADRERHL